MRNFVRDNFFGLFKLKNKNEARRSAAAVTRATVFENLAERFESLQIIGCRVRCTVFIVSYPTKFCP
jgi:hypothetical protein